MSPKVRAILSSGLAVKGRREGRCPMVVGSRRFCCFLFCFKDDKGLKTKKENNRNARHSI